MLRAQPTRISLNSRDLDWHRLRHENRQSQRAKGQPVQLTTKASPHSPKIAQPEEVLLPHRMTLPQSRQLSPIRGMHIPTFSNDQEMRDYWSSVMANAGGAPRVQNVSSGRPTVINVSPISSSTMQASRASFESQTDSMQTPDEDEDDESNYITHGYESDDAMGELESNALAITQGREVGESPRKDGLYGQQLDQATHRRRLSFSFYRRRSTGRQALDQNIISQYPAENTDLDGPSGRGSPNTHLWLCAPKTCLAAQRVPEIGYANWIAIRSQP